MTLWYIFSPENVQADCEYIFDTKRQKSLFQAFQYSEQMSKEVTVIRNMAPINLIIYYPKTEEDQLELAKRVSDVHAAAVTQRVKSLNCPTSQKLALLDAVIETAKNKAGNRLVELDCSSLYGQYKKGIPSQDN